MTDKNAGTQSVLDEMTMGFAGRKADKAARLTPVGVESRPRAVADNPHDGALAFPYDNPDMTQQSIRDALKSVGELKHHLDFVGRGLIEIARVYGLDEGIPAPRVPVTSAVEQAREVAESFDARMARQQAEAQAAVFKTNDAPAERTYGAPAEPEGDGWECPDHGAESLVVLTSRRRNKQYRACKADGCTQFEKV